MENEEAVIFKPAHTPNQNWVKELDPRHMDSTLSTLKAPENDNRVVTLLRPFAVLIIFLNLMYLYKIYS